MTGCPTRQCVWWCTVEIKSRGLRHRCLIKSWATGTWRKLKSLHYMHGCCCMLPRKEEQQQSSTFCFLHSQINSEMSQMLQWIQMVLSLSNIKCRTKRWQFDVAAIKPSVCHFWYKSCGSEIHFLHFSKSMQWGLCAWPPLCFPAFTL